MTVSTFSFNVRRDRMGIRGRVAYSAGWSGGMAAMFTATMAWPPVFNGRIWYQSPAKWTLPVIVPLFLTSMTELIGSNGALSVENATATETGSTMTPDHTREPELVL